MGLPNYLGMDVEFFLKRNGGVIGSEELIPEKGINTGRKSNFGHCGELGGKIVRDGVQIEINPLPNTCRANLCNSVVHIFKNLKQNLGDIEPDFSGVVTVPKENFKKLSENSKKFGCSPDFNTYKNKENKITINPKIIRTRSAGGHIHVGIKPMNWYHHRMNIHDAYNKCHLVESDKKIMNPEIFIPIMDIVVGNTCVLIDKDKINKKRRKIYGRAGDYRLQPHGIEYRTLSNFFLHNMYLTHMVLGLTKTAICIINSELEKKFIKKFNLDKIQRAINNNDVSLAKENFKIFEHFIKTNDIFICYVFPQDNLFYSHQSDIDFIKTLSVKGYKNIFKTSPLESWTEIEEVNQHGGFEKYADKYIFRKKEETKEVVKQFYKE